MRPLHWIGGCLAIALLLAGCGQADNSPKKAALPAKTAPSALRLSAKPLPKMQPIKGLMQHTAAIGTIANPTMDGGIINSADGLPVSQPPVISPPPAPKPAILQVPATTGQTSFKDDWATSNKVQRLLSQAAQGGKLADVLKKSAAMGLPASVAVVPMVESRYQTQAVSPKGAAGAWQLMPSVAKDYGLPSADRFQFAPSTTTALQYLQQLHQQFGNWTLAYAAYNAGSGRVLAALRKNPQAASVNDLDLPTETKEYVAHIRTINQTLMQE
jgi:membrane-bound lytic murein transglycosylase D